MKTFATIAAAALVCASITQAADVDVRGAMTHGQMAATDLRIASKDVLRQPTALLNKNKVAMDNNVAITRSNILVSQNDQLSKHIEAMVTTSDASTPEAAATLSRNILRVSSTAGDDRVMMSKASAVVAAKGDSTMLNQRIADFLHTRQTTKLASRLRTTKAGDSEDSDDSKDSKDSKDEAEVANQERHKKKTPKPHHKL